MEHPITPPPELLEQWLDLPLSVEEQLEVAARWGADQELEACCEWIYQHFQCGLQWGRDLRAARRPKPPSLKQQALETLSRVSRNEYPCFYQDDKDWDIIRRAIESLPDS